MSYDPNYNPYSSPSYVPQQFATNMGQPDPQAYAQRKLIPPAIALAVISLISILHRIADLILLVALTNGGNMAAQGQNQAMIIGGYIGDILIPILDVIIIAAAFQMWNVKSYGLAMTGAVLAVIPLCSPCVVLGIPFGIWALVVLNDPQVKAAFR